MARIDRKAIDEFLRGAYDRAKRVQDSIERSREADAVRRRNAFRDKYGYSDRALDDYSLRQAEFDTRMRNRETKLAEAVDRTAGAEAAANAKRERADALRDAYVGTYGKKGFSTLEQRVDTIDEMWEKEKDRQQVERHKHEAALREIDGSDNGERGGKEGFPGVGLVEKTDESAPQGPVAAQVLPIQYLTATRRYGRIDRSRSEAERKAKEAEAVAKGEWRFNNYAQIELNRRQRRAQQQALLAEAAALDAQDQARNGGPKGVKGTGVYEFGRDGEGNEVRRHSWNPHGTRPDYETNSHLKNARRRAGEAENARSVSEILYDETGTPASSLGGLKKKALDTDAAARLEVGRSELFDDEPKSYRDFEPKLGRPRWYF